VSFPQNIFPLRNCKGKNESQVIFQTLASLFSAFAGQSA
jgi:hypothetical protein